MNKDILYFGVSPDGIDEGSFDGPGDLWHSGLLRGCSGLLSELKYWSPVYWYYLNDVDPQVRSISWRVDATAFAVRASAWEALGGFDQAYISEAGKGLDLGFRLLKIGGIPLHVPDLCPPTLTNSDKVAALPREDVYLFFVRHFKGEYRLYACIREMIRLRSPVREFRALQAAEKRAAEVPAPKMKTLPPRALAEVPSPAPKVSAIIPTMRRQQYTADLLRDYTGQTLPLHEVIVVDATPEGEREPSVYDSFINRLPLSVIWQKSLGSCRARNEAIRLCTGDYILFADDDTRVPPDFVENHIRLLETYNAEAANGLDIRADHYQQTLDDLTRKIEALSAHKAKIGVDTKLSNANNCVRRGWVMKCGGNDVNFDGGYGEDGDFGHRLVEKGAVLLFNPYSANLHLKPPSGGFRWWGEQSSTKKRKRKVLPWEIKRKVGWIKPKPSPTIMYGFLKHYTEDQLREWLCQYILRSWWPSYFLPKEPPIKRLLLLVPRILRTPWILLRIWVSYGFAKDLMQRGPIYE